MAFMHAIWPMHIAGSNAFQDEAVELAATDAVAGLGRHGWLALGGLDVHVGNGIGDFFWLQMADLAKGS
jgi:hypothetical protein